MPFAFTEQGSAMLSGVLNGDVSIQVNISIMRAFMAVRQLWSVPAPTDQRREALMNGYRETMEKWISDI